MRNKSVIFTLILLIIFLPLVFASNNQAGVPFIPSFFSGSGNFSEYYNKTEIDEKFTTFTPNITFNETQFDSEPITIKTMWLTDFINTISKWSNYWSKTENINQSGYNITADYFKGDGSLLINLPEQDLTGYVEYESKNNINMNGYNITNTTSVKMKNNSYGVWSNETDLIIGFIGGLT